jgi:outer membrane protein assembly factor BamB
VRTQLIGAALVAVAIGCRGETPAEVPLKPSTPVPTVSAWSMALRRQFNYPRVAASSLLVTSDSGVTAVSGATGSVLWRLDFPHYVGSVEVVDDVMRIGEIVAPPVYRYTYRDPSSGDVLWPQPDVTPYTGGLVAGIAGTIIERTGEFTLTGRSRTTGELRWSRSMTLVPCTGVQDPCFWRAGLRAATAFFVRYVRQGSQHNIVRVSADGEIVVIPFRDDADGDFIFLKAAQLDASGTRMVIVTSVAAFAIDVATGAELWRIPFAPLVNRQYVPAEPAFAKVVPGPSGSALHVIFVPFPGAALTAAFTHEDASMRDILVNVSTGEIVRRKSYGTPNLSRGAIASCGSAGAVFLTGGAGFTYVDSQTGVESVALYNAPTGPAVPDVSGSLSFLTDFSSGDLVRETSAMDALVGFHCQR